MARQLTDSQITIAKAWLHDVFVWGHLINPKRDISAGSYWYMYGNKNPSYRRVTGDQEACEILCNVLQYRQAETKFIKKADEALEILAQCQFNPDLHSKDIYAHTKKPADMLARFFAWYCSEYKFYWSDANTSKYEMESIRTETVLGKALWEAGCFTSQPDGKAAVKSAGANNSGAATGNPPKNDFKSRGALSSSAVDMMSNPGQKEYLSGSVYSVVGKNANGQPLEDCAYIRPVEADQRIQQKYMTGNTNKVLFGSAKGYGFCPCYFATAQEAEAFLLKVKAGSYKLNSKVVDIVIGHSAALKNGYFKVGTEFGPVYISASKLNEELKEEVNNETNIEPTEDELKGNFAGLTFEDYDNAFHRG